MYVTNEPNRRAPWGDLKVEREIKPLCKVYGNSTVQSEGDSPSKTRDHCGINTDRSLWFRGKFAILHPDPGPIRLKAKCRRTSLHGKTTTEVAASSSPFCLFLELRRVLSRSGSIGRKAFRQIKEGPIKPLAYLDVLLI
jgi:hypothetical protein